MPAVRSPTVGGRAAPRSCAATTAAALWLALTFVAHAASLEIIDRVLAVVNGSVVTLSDLQGALRFGLVAPDPGGDVRAALERLIDRRLALIEVERYAPPEPPVSAIDAAVAAARAKYPSESAFAAALAECGLSLEQLRRHYRDDLRRQTYEEQRFGFALHPTDEEILEYFRTHQDRFRRDGVVPGYEEARADARAAVIAERRAELRREWMAGLRRRADVTILPM